MRKALYSLCATLVILATTVAASPAQAVGYLDLPVPPPSDKVVIDVVTVNGSGCPAGTAAIAMSTDDTAIRVTYSRYMAMVGVGSTATDFRKNCQINLVMHVPAGFTYAITSVDYRGYASVAPGASATLRARYYFQGQTTPPYASYTYNGKYEEDWLTSDEVPIGSKVWSPCGVQRNLNINTELRVSAGTSDTAKTTSFISMESTTVYHFAWASC